MVCACLVDCVRGVVFWVRWYGGADGDCDFFNDRGECAAAKSVSFKKPSFAMNRG